MLPGAVLLLLLLMSVWEVLLLCCSLSIPAAVVEADDVTDDVVTPFQVSKSLSKSCPMVRQTSERPRSLTKNIFVRRLS